jgi:hypothetical protein
MRRAIELISIRGLVYKFRDLAYSPRQAIAVASAGMPVDNGVVTLVTPGQKTNFITRCTPAGHD